MEDTEKRKKVKKDRKKERTRRSRSGRSRSRSSSASSEKISRKRRTTRRASTSSSSSSRSSSSSSSSSRSSSLSSEKIKKKTNVNKTSSDVPSSKPESRFTAQPTISTQEPLTVASVIKSRYPGQENIFTPTVTKVKPELQGNYKHARRLYVGNIPNKLDENHFSNYIYKCLELSGGLLEPGNPVVGVTVDQEKKYVFVDFRSIEETTACLQLDGIIYLGKILRFRRPKQYDTFPKVEGTRPVPTLNLSKLGSYFISTKVEDGPTKLFVGGLPHDMDEASIMEMLMKVGPLKSFYLVKDKMNVSKGFAFCEYYTENDCVKCIEQLNGVNIGPNRVLQIKRAFNLSDRDLFGPSTNVAANLAKNFLEHYNSASNPTPVPVNPTFSMPLMMPPAAGAFYDPYTNQMKAPTTLPTNQFQTNFVPTQVANNMSMPNVKPTNVICISNMTNPQELENDSTFEEIYEDIKEEILKIGPIRSMIIPRIKDGYQGSCLGKVYIEFENINSATIAVQILGQYKYDGRTLQPNYYDPVNFMERTLM